MIKVEPCRMIRLNQKVKLLFELNLMKIEDPKAEKHPKEVLKVKIKKPWSNNSKHKINTIVKPTKHQSKVQKR